LFKPAAAAKQAIHFAGFTAMPCIRYAADGNFFQRRLQKYHSENSLIDLANPPVTQIEDGPESERKDYEYDDRDRGWNPFAGSEDGTSAGPAK
jgi:hypothetical protein